MKLNARAFALSAGIWWGVAMFLGTVLAAWTGWGENFFEFFIRLYPGYSISFGGGIVALILGFIDMFIGCYIFAWLYNKFAGKDFKRDAQDIN